MSKKTKGTDQKMQKVLDNMVPALRTELEKILEEINSAGEHDIRRRIGIGKRISTLSSDRTGTYGLDPAADIGAVLKISQESVVLMVRVAEAFEDKDIENLIEMAHPVTNEKLTWNHYVTLARIPDKKKAFEYAASAVKSGWSTKDLAKAVIRGSGGPKSAGGRHPKKHAHIDGTLADIEMKVGMIHNSAGKVWLAPGGLADQFDKMASVPGWRASPDLIEQMQRTKEAVEQMMIDSNCILSSLVTLLVRAKANMQMAQRKIA